MFIRRQIEMGLLSNGISNFATTKNLAQRICMRNIPTDKQLHISKQCFVSSFPTFVQKPPATNLQRGWMRCLENSIIISVTTCSIKINKRVSRRLASSQVRVTCKTDASDRFLELIESSNQYLDPSLYPKGSLFLPNRDGKTARDEILGLINEWEKNMAQIDQENPVLDHRKKKMQYHGAEVCDALLKRLIDESRKNKQILPGLAPFRSCIECFRISRRSDAGQRSWKILQAWNGLFGGDLDRAPGTEAFNLVLNVYKDTANTIPDAKDAMKILDLMNDLRDGGNLYVKSDQQSTNFVLKTWQNVLKNSKTTDEAEMILSNATKLFNESLELSGTGDKTSIWDAHVSFLRINIGFVQIMHQMMSSHFDESHIEKHAHEINLWKRVQNDAEEKLDSLLLEMNKMPISSLGYQQELDGNFLSLINAFAGHVFNTSKEGYIEKTIHRMKLLLGLMRALSQTSEAPDTTSKYILPATKHYHAIIKFCERFGEEKQNPQMTLNSFAQHLLDEVERKLLASKLPNTVKDKQLLGEIFYSCIKICARTKPLKDKEMAAETILLRMIMHLNDNKIAMDPKDILSSFNEVIIGWSRCHKNQARMAAARAESLLQYLTSDDAIRLGIKPSSASFSGVICAFSRVGNEQKAMELLSQMESLCASHENNLEDCSSEESHISVRPNILTYTFVMEHLSSSKKALALWKRIEQQYNKYRHPSMKPDANAYRAVIDALTRSKEPGMAARAEAFLDEMIRQYEYECSHETRTDNSWIRPNKFVFTSVIHAWANDKYNPKSSEHALKILHKMKHMCLDPDTITYTAVIKALSQGKSSDGNDLRSADKSESKNVQYALQILEDMEYEYYQNANESVKPNTYTYTEVIKTLCNNASINNLGKANELLNQMILSMDSSMYPSNYTFQVLLNACCSFGKEDLESNGNEGTMNERLRVACEIVLKSLTQYRQIAPKMNDEPDEYIYGAMFRAYSCLIANSFFDSDDIQVFMMNELKQCCVNGSVSKFILKQLQSLPVKETNAMSLRTKDGEMITDFDDVPFDWKRNVGRRKVMRRKKHWA